MLTLAVDASTNAGAAALISGGECARLIEFAGGRSRKGGAAEAMAELSKEEEIEQVVVGTGPGSYNGLRASIAACWGFARGRQVHLCGVSSLLGIAAGSYVVVGDARQDQCFFAVVEGGRFACDPELVATGDLAQRIAGFPGLALYANGPLPLELDGHTPGFPCPLRLASVAALTCRGGGQLVMPEPIYLKPPHITKPRQQS